MRGMCALHCSQERRFHGVAYHDDVGRCICGIGVILLKQWAVHCNWHYSCSCGVQYVQNHQQQRAGNHCRCAAFTTLLSGLVSKLPAAHPTPPHMPCRALLPNKTRSRPSPHAAHHAAGAHAGAGAKLGWGRSIGCCARRQAHRSGNRSDMQLETWCRANERKQCSGGLVCEGPVYLVGRQGSVRRRMSSAG